MKRKIRTKKEGLTHQVIHNAFFQGLSGIISKIGGFIFTIIIARLLFPEIFGLYSLALSIILILITVSDLGLGQTAVRYIAESLGKKKKKEARSRYLFLLRFRFFIALITAVLLFFLANPLATLFKKPGLVLPLQVGSIYLFITALYGTIRPIFLAIQKLKYSAIAEAIFQTTRIALIFVFLYFYKTAWSVFVVLAFASFIALLFTFLTINKRFPFLIKGRKEKVERKRLLVFSGFLALGTLGMLIFGNIDKLMLGYFLEAKFIGYYNAILTLVSGVLGLTGFANVVFPVFTQLHGKRLKRAFKKTFYTIAIIAFPAAIGLAYIALPALQIFYGQAYVPAEYRTALLLTSVFLALLVLESLLSNVFVMLFNAKEKPKIPAFTTLAVSILNIILNLILITSLVKIKPSYGLIGAAAATFMSRYTRFGILASLSRKKLKTSFEKSIFKPFLATLVMLAFLFIFDYFVDLNIFTGIVMILLAACIYFFVMFLIRGITKKDFKLVKFMFFARNRII